MTLKLSDGDIDAHKMILAAVSPVFEKMLYGDFKEGRSCEVALPNDSCKIMKILIDFVYNGKCEVNSLDDILPLLEVIDRYQINKVPFQHMIGDAVLGKLDSSNYLVVLLKYASVMSEEASRRAAEKVMMYINYDIASDFSTTKQIPENVLLSLLQMFNFTNYDLEIFEFLVKWHRYQTSTLGISLQLTSEIFKCIRYSLIIPQMLSAKVACCDLVDRQLLSHAYHYIYTSCRPLGEYNSDDPCKPPTVQLTRKPELGLKIEWIANSGISIRHGKPNEITVSGQYDRSASYIIKSPPLGNGIFSFYASGKDLYLSFAITKTNACIPAVHQYAEDFKQYNLVTLYVYNSYLFVKYIVSGVVKSTYSVSDQNGCCITIFMCPGWAACAKPFICFNLSCCIKGDDYDTSEPGLL